MKSMAVLILSLSGLVAQADTYACKSIFGDGVDARILVKIGAPTDGTVRLPYVGPNDASGSFRLVTISGLDKVSSTIDAFGIGTANGNNINLTLINKSGQNIGVMANGLVTKNDIRFDLFGGIAGDWLSCSKED